MVKTALWRNFETKVNSHSGAHKHTHPYMVDMGLVYTVSTLTSLSCCLSGREKCICQKEVRLPFSLKQRQMKKGWICNSETSNKNKKKKERQKESKVMVRKSTIEHSKATKNRQSKTT